MGKSNAMVLLLWGCGSEDGLFHREGGEKNAPTVSQVRISPAVPYVDGPVSCSGEVEDRDDDLGDIEQHISWSNTTRGSSLGKGSEITLSPNSISPGESLECTIEVTDPAGNEGSGSERVEPGCGFYDLASLSDVDLSLEIVFRPVKSEDLNPGDDGAPWDWDGNIPDWILDVVGALSDLLGWASDWYPAPELVAAAEAADFVDQILQMIDEYGPELMEGTVPPDPDLFPYVFDEDGNIYTFWSGSDGEQWEDSYEVHLDLDGVDLRRYAGFAMDMEDIDLAFDDDMGDLLDQDSYPLILLPTVFAEGAYCSSIFYNPSSEPRESDVSYLPSSILWLRVEAR